jgi:hypothetical protein
MAFFIPLTGTLEVHTPISASPVPHEGLYTFVNIILFKSIAGNNHKSIMTGWMTIK